MDQFEDDLKRVLQRQRDAVPAGFEGRTMARIRRGDVPKGWFRGFGGVVWPAAATACMVVVSYGGFAAYRHHQAIEARDQLVLALRVTGQKLDVVREQLEEKRSTMAIIEGSKP